MITMDPSFNFGLGAVVGFVARTLIDHFFAIRRTGKDRRIKAFNDAATKFRSIVIKEHAGLYPETIDWPKDIISRLNTTLPTIQAAVEEFKPFVSAGEVKSFSKVWDQYYAHCKHTLPEACSTANVLYGTKKPNQAREDFKHTIDLLLSFAEIK